MLTKENGIKAIMALQLMAGIVESIKDAERGWDNMSQSERINTEAAYKILCESDLGD